MTIFKLHSQEEEKSEPVVEFWLEKDEMGQIDLCARNTGGCKTYIVTIDPDTGTMTKHGGVANITGLATNEKGQIKMEN